jgi:hypothetical protein
MSARFVLETLTAIRRAGADIIITYHAKDAANGSRSVEATPKIRSRARTAPRSRSTISTASCST